MLSRQCYLPVVLFVWLGPLGACNVSTPVDGPSTEPEPPVGEQTGDGAVADFSLIDVNANSSRYGEAVSPRDYLGQVSAWYFGRAT